MSKKISSSRLRELLAAAGQARILVLGDLMLDQFLWGTVARISPEAPVPVVEFERESFIPGGAGNVARNLAHLGVRTEMLSVCGLDASADRLKQLLSEEGEGILAWMVDGAVKHLKELDDTGDYLQTASQKERIAEINSLYGSKIAEKETFLQGEVAKEKIKGDMAAVAQIQDQLTREMRRLHVEWEEKKAAVHGEPTAFEAETERREKS